MNDLLSRVRRSIRSSAVDRPCRNLTAYDVFLNFRGKDTRGGFVDHLRENLKSVKVRVFKDDRHLIGQQIAPGILQAIDDCQIAILVISKGYGASQWCLDELWEIMHRRTQPGRVVLPVFYDVDDSDVRRLSGEFGKAFRGLAERCTPEQGGKWKEALSSLARIKGWSLREDADGREGKLVKMVVNRVLSTLNKGTSVFPISSPATKKGWASELKRSLKENNVSVFSDDDQSLIGKDLADETRNAMDHCEIFIPIISEDFASSHDCLDGLVQMCEFIDTNGSRILPIFYKTDPSQNRFQEDMRLHDVSSYTYQQWQQSIERVFSSGGLVSANIGNGDEGKLLQKAIKRVDELLRPHA